MREKNRNSIASCIKFPQFITMNVIDGQAGLIIYSSLIFGSLTINNILNIIILLILAGVAISSLTESGLFEKSKIAKQKQAETEVKEKINLIVSEYAIEREQGKTLFQFLTDKKDKEEIDNFTDNGDGTFDVIINGYTTTITESDLSTTEPVILSDVMVTISANGFAENKVQALITAKSLSGGIKEIRLINNVVLQGNNKNTIAFDQIIEANTEYQVEVELTNGTISTKTIKYEDLEGPSVKITPTYSSFFVSSPLTAKIEVADKSGINLNSSKWIVNQSNESLGTDESLYTGGTLTSEDYQLQTSSITEAGEYYIHILATDNLGYKTEKISDLITIRSGYGIYTAGDFMTVSIEANNTYYLMDDIDMSGYDASQGNFAEFWLYGTWGTFDGQGHTISNLSSSSYVFYNYSGNVTIKNVIFKDVSLGSYLCTRDNGTVSFEKVGLTGETNRNGSTYGGVFMCKDGGSYTDCYVRATIVGGSYKTPWTGYNWPYSITRCYSASNCNFNGPGTQTNSYYDSDLASVGLGTALTTEQFANAENFDGWDFKESETDTDYTWYIDEETGYPELHF